ncbi:hypothetical protein IDVR_37540 [Intrasporangium sp. DVR]
MTSNYRRPRPTEPPPVVPGLGPDSVAGLSPAAVSARVAAADERRAEAERRTAARALAHRVAALPPRARPATPPETPRVPRGAANAPGRDSHTDVVPNNPQSGAQREATPKREGPLVIPLRPSAEPPTLTPDEIAALGRLLAQAPHRRDRQRFATSTPPTRLTRSTARPPSSATRQRF